MSGPIGGESALAYATRPASGEPEGLLVLQHGRGTDERDLLPLGDALDPDRRLLVVAPRGPLQLPGSPGNHWYVVRRVGYPDPDTFHTAFARLTEFHDLVWERTGIATDRTILGGFSMGSVMSYATGLAPGRPRPAGILAYSGFVPTVEGWTPELEGRVGLPVLIAHGTLDPVIGVEFGRAAHRLLTEAGLAVRYLESDVGHTIDPAHLEAARSWVGEIVAGTP
jgi:phospholipase/carboxylesterase